MSVTCTAFVRAIMTLMIVLSIQSSLIAEQDPAFVKKQPKDQGFYTFDPKFVCGVPGGDSPDDLISRFSVRPLAYATNINVHNPQEHSVKFRWKAVQVKPIEQVTDWTVLALKPNHGLKIDCRDVKLVLEATLGHPFAEDNIFFWEGMVILENQHDLDVTVVYTSDDEIVLEKQEILFRFVQDPYKSVVIVENGPGLKPLPPTGPRPVVPANAPNNLKAVARYNEVMSMDFEYEFVFFNKIFCEFPVSGGRGTKEILIPGPTPETPFPPGTAVLEELVREKIPRCGEIRQGYPALIPTGNVKQEAVYRWVSDPIKIVVETRQNEFIFPIAIVTDDDQNGQPDDPPNDPALPAGFSIEILDSDIGVGAGKGHSEDVEAIEGKRKAGKPHPSLQ